MEHDPIKPPPQVRGMVISNLYIVYCDGHVLLGKIDPPPDLEKNKVVLMTNTIEVVSAPRQGPNGQVQFQLNHFPIPPFGGPVDIEVVASMIVSVKMDDDILPRLYAHATGATPILLGR